MTGNGTGPRGRHRRCRGRRFKGGIQKPLSECCEETSHTIVENTDKQSMEMGLYAGAQVKVIRNSLTSPNMVVGVNDSRYMLSKETARRITVA